MDFERKTMLLKLSIGQFNPKKLDRSATAAVQSAFNADADAGNFQKILIAPRYLEPITRAISDLRGWHDANTLPWFYAGWRIIPTRHHGDYMTGYRTRKAYFHDKVSAFLREYDPARAQAARSLGALFNAAEYPDEIRIRSKYYCDLTPMPFPAVGDWRADIANGEMTVIREQAEESVRAALADAQAEAWARLHGALESMARKLSIPHDMKGPDGKAFKNAHGETGIIKGSLDAFRELLEVLPGLNLFEDPNLDAIISETVDLLGKTTAAEMREDPLIRALTGGVAADICQRMAGFMGDAPLNLKTTAGA